MASTSISLAVTPDAIEKDIMAARKTGNGRLEASKHVLLAEALLNRREKDDVARALRHLTNAIEIYCAQGSSSDLLLAAEACRRRGDCYRGFYKHRRAIVELRRAVETLGLSHLITDNRIVGSADVSELEDEVVRELQRLVCNLGLAYYHIGAMECEQGRLGEGFYHLRHRAQVYARGSLGLAEELSARDKSTYTSEKSVLDAMYNLCTVLLEMGDYQKAIHLLGQAKSCAEKLCKRLKKDSPGWLECLKAQGRCELDVGRACMSLFQYDEALRHMRYDLGVCETIKMRKMCDADRMVAVEMWGVTTMNIGLLHLARGDLEQAHAAFANARQSFKLAAPGRMEELVTNEQATQAKGQAIKQIKVLEARLVKLRGDGLVDTEEVIQLLLEQIASEYDELGKPEAITYWSRAIDMRDGPAGRFGLAKALYDRYSSCESQVHLTQALQHAEKALDSFASPADKARCCDLMGNIRTALNMDSEAVNDYDQALSLAHGATAKVSIYNNLIMTLNKRDGDDQAVSQARARREVERLWELESTLEAADVMARPGELESDIESESDECLEQHDQADVGELVRLEEDAGSASVSSSDSADSSDSSEGFDEEEDITTMRHQLAEAMEYRDSRWERRMRLRIAAALMDRQRYREALGYHDQLFRAAEKRKRWGQAANHALDCGICYCSLGQYGDGIAVLSQALTCAKQHARDSSLVQRSHMQLGIAFMGCYINQPLDSHADDWLDKADLSLKEAEKVSADARQRSLVLYNRAELSSVRGDIPSAAVLYLKALEEIAIYRGDVRETEIHKGRVCFSLGLCRLEQREFEKAVDCFAKDARICQRYHDLDGERKALERMSEAYRKLNQLDQALQSARQCRDVLARLPERVMELEDAEESISVIRDAMAAAVSHTADMRRLGDMPDGAERRLLVKTMQRRLLDRCVAADIPVSHELEQVAKELIRMGTSADGSGLPVDAADGFELLLGTLYDQRRYEDLMEASDRALVFFDSLPPGAAFPQQQASILCNTASAIDDLNAGVEIADLPGLVPHRQSSSDGRVVSLFRQAFDLLDDGDSGDARSKVQQTSLANIRVVLDRAGRKDLLMKLQAVSDVNHKRLVRPVAGISRLSFLDAFCASAMALPSAAQDLILRGAAVPGQARHMLPLRPVYRRGIPDPGHRDPARLAPIDGYAQQRRKQRQAMRRKPGTEDSKKEIARESKSFEKQRAGPADASSKPGALCEDLEGDDVFARSWLEGGEHMLPSDVIGQAGKDVITIRVNGYPLNIAYSSHESVGRLMEELAVALKAFMTPAPLVDHLKYPSGKVLSHHLLMRHVVEELLAEHSDRDYLVAVCASTATAIDSYLATCRQMSVKPDSQVVSAMQCATVDDDGDFSPRDVHLSLEGFGLDDKAMLPVLHSLANVQHLIGLNLSFNSFGKLALSEFTAALKNSEHGQPAFPHLTSVDISSTNVRGDALEAWLVAMRQVTSLRQLNLSGLPLGLGACKALGDLFTFCSLHSLNLSHWPGLDTGVIRNGLAPALALATTLTSLDLSSTELRADGLDSLATALSRATSLFRLDLSLCGVRGPKHLVLEGVTSLLSPSSSLTELNLSGVSLGAAGADSMSTCWTAGLGAASKLSCLVLADCCFRSSDTDKLITAISELPSLTKLDLSGNEVCSSGAELLANIVVSRPGFAPLRHLLLNRTGLALGQMRHLLASAAGDTGTLHSLAMEWNGHSLVSPARPGPCDEEVAAMRDLLVHIARPSVAPGLQLLCLSGLMPEHAVATVLAAWEPLARAAGKTVSMARLTKE